MNTTNELKQTIEHALMCYNRPKEFTRISNREISNIADFLTNELVKSGITIGHIHPDFKSCSKCIVFHEAPHHEQCLTCDNMSNFKSAEKICSRCGNHIGGTQYE